MTHRVQCKCGTIRGQLDTQGISSRIHCYCTDCRAFARFLGREADVLDQQGGTEIVQVAQSRLHLTQGADRFAAVRLSERGMVRWYATCCKTPLGNTLSNPRISFVGLIHTALDRANMDRDFGAVIGIVNTTSALGESKPTQRGMVAVIGRFIRMVFMERISGRYKNSQFFTGAGAPVVTPTVLRPDELNRLKSAG